MNKGFWLFRDSFSQSDKKVEIFFQGFVKLYLFFLSESYYQLGIHCAHLFYGDVINLRKASVSVTSFHVDFELCNLNEQRESA